MIDGQWYGIKKSNVFNNENTLLNDDLYSFFVITRDRSPASGVGEATVTFRWHSSRWTNCRRVETRAETCSLDKRSRGEEEDRMERDRARPKKGGVHTATCALSRYWNDKWNIRNKSCKTLFSGDNTASSLWTLSRVGAPYCATSGR